MKFYKYRKNSMPLITIGVFVVLALIGTVSWIVSGTINDNLLTILCYALCVMGLITWPVLSFLTAPIKLGFRDVKMLEAYYTVIQITENTLTEKYGKKVIKRDLSQYHFYRIVSLAIGPSDSNTMNSFMTKRADYIVLEQEPAAKGQRNYVLKEDCFFLLTKKRLELVKQIISNNC